ncbi:MAG: VanZ family protein [Euryarchaeota archaeon]|nr:VanZ family protein [Planctomycetota bacterium]MBU4491977.1 VanZ family protein [Euryarchaeota archaeon]
MSSIPDKSLWGGSSLIKQIISNLAHIPAYGILTLLWLKTFDRTRNRNQLLMFNALILTGLVLFAVSDEIHQSFTPGRSASGIDVGLDLLGVFFGLSAFKICRIYTERQKEQKSIKFR